MTPVFANVLATVQMELSLRKTEALLKLTDYQIEYCRNRAAEEKEGNEVIDVDEVAQPGPSAPARLPRTHRSSFSTYQILAALNADIEAKANEELRECEFFTVHIDESTGRENKFMMNFLRYLPSGMTVSKERFAKVVAIDRCNAERIVEVVVGYLQSVGMTLARMVMFTSDGASVMTGPNTGVAKRLRDQHAPHLLDFHCACHAEALAVKDAYTVRFY
jgi:hypothetical protein